VHWEAYEFLRNSVLNANTFFNNEAGIGNPAFTQNQFAVNVGGPLLIPKVYNGRDKTFWFFSYEGFRLRQGQSFVDTVLTLAERAGNFSGLVDSNGNPITNLQSEQHRAKRHIRQREPNLFPHAHLL
jgi:hypothetical protein